MAKTLVLGLGNILLRDEGVGVRVVERLLERYQFPREVQVIDGGTLGLNLLSYVEDASRLLVIDAVEAGKPPGSLVRLTGEEIPAFLDVSKLSAHQQGLQELLAVAKLRGRLPREVVFWGVELESRDVGLELSPSVEAQLGAVVEAALSELAAWGMKPGVKSARGGNDAPGPSGEPSTRDGG